MTTRWTVLVRVLLVAGALVAPAAATAPVTAAPASADGSAFNVEQSRTPGTKPSPLTGSAFVVQALPGRPVSVSVDGELEQEDVALGDVLGPLDIAPGKHTVTVTGSDPEWTMEAAVTTTAGGSVDVVLHRPASVQGPPKVTVYRNPVGAVPAGKGRVMVAHTATLPPADISVDGRVIFSNIANGEFATAEVPAGTREVSILPTGRTSPVLLGPLELAAKPGTLTQVFAVGRPSTGSMDVIVHTLPLPTRGSAAPDRVETGSAGLVSGLQVRVTPDSTRPSPGRGARCSDHLG